MRRQPQNNLRCEETNADRDNNRQGIPYESRRLPPLPASLFMQHSMAVDRLDCVEIFSTMIPVGATHCLNIAYLRVSKSTSTVMLMRGKKIGEHGR
jgi:hypothetical protein